MGSGARGAHIGLTAAERSSARSREKDEAFEKEYARSFLAGERSRALLLAKTERVARLLADFLTQVAPSAVFASGDSQH